MTLCISWIRKLKKHEELVIATDSRLRSNGSWNCSPKILTFARTDCAICFEGDTTFAYPMMIQLQTAVANYQKAISAGLIYYNQLLNIRLDFPHSVDEYPQEGKEFPKHIIQ